VRLLLARAALTDPDGHEHARDGDHEHRLRDCSYDAAVRNEAG
jgi:hypothetical protein